MVSGNARMSPFLGDLESDGNSEVSPGQKPGCEKRDAAEPGGGPISYNAVSGLQRSGSLNFLFPNSWLDVLVHMKEVVGVIFCFDR